MNRLQHVNTWQLVILLLLFGFMAATFLRLNNIGMVQRRDAVYAADKAGDKDVIRDRLLDLQHYVSAHMNTDMGSVYLENQYRIDSQKVIDSASGSNSPNGNIYKKADDSCAPEFNRYTQGYLQCIVNYLAQFPPADNSAGLVKLPRADAYRYAFVSPLWSPDFAGFSILICVIITLFIAIRLTGVIVLRVLIKKANKG